MPINLDCICSVIPAVPLSTEVTVEAYQQSHFSTVSCAEHFWVCYKRDPPYISETAFTVYINYSLYQKNTCLFPCLWHNIRVLNKPNGMKREDMRRMEELRQEVKRVSEWRVEGEDCD